MEWLIDHPEALAEQMPAIAAALGSRRKIALYGDMGAGKTTFVAAFCRFLGAEAPVSSPTFSLINEYAFTDESGGPALIHHLDLYRLKNAEEAFDIGIEEMLYDTSYCLIEWPQLVEALLPEHTVKIDIEMSDETRRRILIL